MRNIVVIFQAAGQHTEGLALALGLGAVQAGANIRLRHLDPAPSAELAHAGYGVLRADDLRWAGGIAVILESAHPVGLVELEASLDAIKGPGEATNQWAYLFHEDPASESLLLVQSLLRGAGLQLLEDSAERSATPAYMTHTGQRLAERSEIIP